MAAPLPPVSRPLRSWFCGYVQRYLLRHFSAVRQSGMPCRNAGPVVVYLNHPSWWDALTGVWLAQHHWPDRQHHAPIAAAGLAKYPFFGRLGFYPVVPNRTGLRAFRETSLAILADPGRVLWITAQGEFADVRQRPVRLAGGLGHLAAASGVVCQPLAVEYVFWTERRPELLVRWGEPLQPPAGSSPAALTAALTSRLQTTMEELAALAIARDPTAFVTLLEGSRGVGGVYDLWRRARATLAGQRFDPSHGAAP